MKRKREDHEKLVKEKEKMLDEMQQEESDLTLLRDRNKSDQTELNRLQEVLIRAKKM